MIEERISHAKQSSDLTYRSITRPTKAHDSDVIAALGVADALVMQAMTAAGESGAVYVRDLQRAITGYLRHHKGINAREMANQVCRELLIDRCENAINTARCVNGRWVPIEEYSGEPATGWPDCPLCLGSGRAKVDQSARDKAAGRPANKIYEDALDWCAKRMMAEGGNVWRLLR